MDYAKINAMCDEYAQFAVSFRRDLHKHPEAAWTEFRTTALLAERLEAEGIKVLMGTKVVNPEFVMGYPDKEMITKNMVRAVNQGAKQSYVDRTEGYTGAVAVIETGRPGPVLGMRFDIDSNDVSENTTNEHRPTREGFASVNENAMHACGHDGHATMGLVTALVLNKIKDSLCGTIKIVFQPAEEGVRGALSVCKSGILDDVDFMLGGHIGEDENGELSVKTNTGGYLATDKFDVFFKGEASHAGGSPEKGKNALLAAAMATLAMETQVQDGRGIGRCNVGKLIAGTGRNVIPAEAMMCVETRGTTTDIAKKIYDNAMNSIDGAAKMYDVTYDIKKMGGAASAKSDDDFRDIVNEVVREGLHIEPITQYENSGGSEDYTYMMSTVQAHGGRAMHMFLGTKRTGSAHNEWFDFGEDVLIFSAKIYADCALKICGNK